MKNTFIAILIVLGNYSFCQENFKVIEKKQLLTEMGKNMGNSIEVTQKLKERISKNENFAKSISFKGNVMSVKNPNLVILVKDSKDGKSFYLLDKVLVEAPDAVHVIVSTLLDGRKMASVCTCSLNAENPRSIDDCQFEGGGNTHVRPKCVGGGDECSCKSRDFPIDADEPKQKF